MEEKVGGYISKITFNNNETLDIRPDDIVVFVGPNNVGKSQSLNDIFSLAKSNAEKETPTKVVSDINICKYKPNIIEYVKSNFKIDNTSVLTNQYKVFNHSIPISNEKHEIEQYAKNRGLTPKPCKSLYSTNEKR